MPSQTFMNLEKEKQDKLIAAAIKEFSAVSYQNVSINKIIATAGISRGSFYMYFADKEEIFEYIIEISRNKINKLVKETFVNNSGDLQQSFKILYDELLLNICKKEYMGIFKNIFIFFHIKKDSLKQPSHILFEYVKDDINITNIKKEDKEFIFNMFLNILFSSLAEAIKNDNSPLIKEKYLKKINILCYGIYKEGNK